MADRQVREQVSEYPDRAQFLVRSLHMLLEAEGNFIAIYDTLLDKVESEDTRKTIAEFRGDHLRHVAEVARVVTEMGGPSFSPAGPTPLGAAIADQIRTMANDHERLRLFRVGEEMSRHLYDAFMGFGAPEPVVRVLNQALEDEERHYAWVSEKLGEAKRPL